MFRIMINCLLCAAVSGAALMSISGAALMSASAQEGRWRLCTPAAPGTGYCLVALASIVSCTYREGGSYPTQLDACNAAHNGDNAPYCTGVLFGCNLSK